MNISTLIQANNFTIKVNDRFDFSLHNDFSTAFKAVDNSMNFILDLSSCNYMDSAALGMLFQLREFANKDKSKLQLTHCSKEIKRTLNSVGFNTIFQIS